jgi:beta-lactamase regulating signal transducer with metallopeptidase domain
MNVTGFLVELLITGTVVALVIALAFSIAKAAAPRLRYCVAVIAFFAAALLPLVPRSAKLPRGSETALVVVKAAPQQAIALADRTPATPYALLVWIAVAVILLAREAAGHAVLHFRRREWDAASSALREQLSWPGDVPLFLAEHEGPSTIGLVSPIVVLPTAWLPSRSIARHELAHARWRDPLINALIRITRALFWPSIALWYLERVVRTEREVAADLFAVEGCADRQATVADYASSLVEAAQRCRRRHRVATALGNSIGLEERVTRLFSIAQPSTVRLALAALVLFCGTAATVAIPAGDSTPPPHPMPARASAQYQQSARAMNEILSRTQFHNHEGTATVRQLLDQIRVSGTTQPVLDALNAPDRRTRESVAWIAGELGDPSLVPALIARLSDTDPHVQQASAWALGMIGDARAIRSLIAALDARGASARHGAAWALGRLRASEAVAPLIARLEDSASDVQHGAAFALGAIGDARAIAPLEALYERTWNRDVKREASRALTRFGRTPRNQT